MKQRKVEGEGVCGNGATHIQLRKERGHEAAQIKGRCAATGPHTLIHSWGRNAATGPRKEKGGGALQRGRTHSDSSREGTRR